MDPQVVTITSASLPPYFIGWGTLSLINAGLAQSKGHSGLFWWFVSLFLGPVATFLIVVFLQAPPLPRPLAPTSFKQPRDPELA